jgi:hypothetical protein
MTTNEKINLQLGDIIQIESPSNLNYHEKICLISYIDKNKLKLISETNEFILLINEDGNFLEESIENINILHRNESSSYIKQNNLKIQQNISIYFNGSSPFIINGIISNIEEDMIEVSIEESDEIIYIDFAYSGIPDKMNIEKIVINDKIKDPTIDESKDIDSSIQEDNIESHDIEIKDDDFDIMNINQGKQIVLEELDLDNELEEIYYNVNVSESEKRYSLEDQVNDYLNYSIGILKPENKTQQNYENINREINRFIELREIYSDYDDNQNLKLPKLKNEFYKPLKESILNIDKKINWILPVINSKKIICEKSDESLIDDDNENVVKDTNKLFIKKLKDSNEKWIKNSSKEKINNYKKYINDLYDIFDSNINYSDNNLIVNSNINVINDNENDNYYSYCFSNQTLTKKRFNQDVYNPGLKMQEIDYFNGKKILVQTQLTKNEEININSFITLPLPFINYSKINSNYTNLADKVTYSNINLNYFKLLNDKTFVNEYILTQETNKLFKNSDKNIHNNNIFETINNFQYEKLNDSYDNYMENINDLLESFIPTNNVFISKIFEYRNIYNLSQLLDLLQTANIDYYNIHNNSYNIIKKELEKSSDKYKLEYIKNTKELDKIIQEINKDIKPDKIIYSFKLLNKEHKNNIFENYKIDEAIINNDEELISKIISIDNARFFNSSLNKSVIDLTVSNLLDSFIKEEERLSKKAKKNELSDDYSECEKYILSKKYNSIQELENDNNKNIYFDSIYDKTLYSLINNYNEEKQSMDNPTFKKFLIEEIKEKMNLTEEKATREAKSIIDEKREIIDNDYALLINKDDNKNYIYIRNENVWKIDEKFKDNFYIDSNKIFCDVNKKCMSKDEKCQPMNNIINKFDKNNIDEILKSFDLKYSISIEEIKGAIIKEYEYNKKLLEKKIIIINNYNEKKNNLLLKFNRVDTESDYFVPNEILRDKILSYPDITKKNYYIRIFSLNFLRYPNLDEEKYWLYCKNTNKKILPLFMLRLANVFDNKEEYLIELDTICAEQGTISDDNSFWVDKYSGYIIKRIEFSNDEGYDESGYKLNTRDLLKKDYEFGSINKPISKEASYINAIVSTIGQMIGLNLVNYNEQININVFKLLKKNISDKKTYDKKIEQLIRKDPRAKNLPSFEDAYNNLLLMYTISYICIFIQTSIPSFKTKKTFPGCIKSFDGYPLKNQEDKTFILYISCIVNKIKTSVKPWNTIQKMSETNICKKIELIIKDHILIDPFFIDLIDKKLEYLKLNETEEIPEEISINGWFDFMPPLNDIKLKESNLVPIDKTFTDNMLNGFKKSNKDNVIDLINSKIIYYSLKIVNSIQKIVKKKTPILQTSNGEPYIENSCCNSLNNTIQYFIKEDKTIYEDNILLKNYLEILKDIFILEKSSILYHKENTKILVSKPDNDFSEKIIYEAFIYYCNFDNSIPIDNELKAICNTKPNNIDYNNNITDIIDNIKSQGRVYGKNSLYDLLDIVNKKTMKLLIKNENILNNIENIRYIINDYNSNKLIEKFDDILIDKLYDLIDRYDFIKFKNDDTNDIKNYLFKVNNLLHGEIKNKLKTFDFVTKKEFANFENNLVFNFDIEHMYLFKNYLKDFIDILPNIIINKSINYNKIPDHWKLSEIHVNDVKNIVSNYYESYLNFNNTSSLEHIFSHIKSKYKIFKDLSEYFMYFEEIKKQDDDVINSIFDKDLLNLLYTNFYLNLFTEYLNILENNEFELMLLANDEDYDKNHTYNEIFQYLNIFLNTLTKHYNLINLKYKNVKDNILFAKEKEKDIITDFLKNLSDESREIENIFKNNKLEKWNKGLQKGITQYVKENYDQERKELEKQAILEQKIKKNDIVTEMNKEIYKMDIEEEEFNNGLIEDEEYDMNHIADDDDYTTDNEY